MDRGYEAAWPRSYRGVTRLWRTSYSTFNDQRAGGIVPALGSVTGLSGAKNPCAERFVQAHFALKFSLLSVRKIAHVFAVLNRGIMHFSPAGSNPRVGQSFGDCRRRRQVGRR